MNHNWFRSSEASLYTLLGWTEQRWRQRGGQESRGTASDVAALTCGCLSLLCGCPSLLCGCPSLLCGCLSLLCGCPSLLFGCPSLLCGCPSLLCGCCLSLPVFRTVISPRSNAATSAHLFKAYVENVRCCYKKNKSNPNSSLDMP